LKNNNPSPQWRVFSLACGEGHHIGSATRLDFTAQRIGGHGMKFLKYFALLALASVPLLIVERRKQASAPSVSDDDIFERELRVD
jgi:hypothetical protein